MPLTPMIDDVELRFVQVIRQETAPHFAEQTISGLEGTLHQKLGRRSHRVWLEGVLVADDAATLLESLQDKATLGEEVTFVADIATALEVEKMVVTRFRAEQVAGAASRFSYAIELAESPPLPPPAEVSGFGGLDDFGFGDLGFDPGALGDVMNAIEEGAAAVSGALDAALDVVGALETLASLGNVAEIGNPIGPLVDKVGELGGVAGDVGELGAGLGSIFGGGG